MFTKVAENYPSCPAAEFPVVGNRHRDTAEMLICWRNSAGYVLLPHITTVSPVLRRFTWTRTSFALSRRLFGRAKLLLFTHSVGFYAPHRNDRTSHRGRLQGLAVVALVCVKIQLQRGHTGSGRVFTKLETTQTQNLTKKRDSVLCLSFCTWFSPPFM